MEFKTPAQQQIYEKVAQYMKEIFGEMVRVHQEKPWFYVYEGSAFCTTNVYAIGEDDAVINTRSYVVTQIELVPELLKFLLLENDSMRFGSFGIDKDNDIFFEHAILGSTCDKEELKASVLAVVRTADKYDDTITQRWGGLRFADR
jgi:hypothetical protein